MELEQRLEQTQKLILTQTMQQSLQCLQMPVQELRSFLEDAALSNPLLDVEDTPLGTPYPETAEGEYEGDAESGLPIEFREQIVWESGRNAPDSTDFTTFFARPKSFTDHLNEQLGQMVGLDQNMLALCRYLVGCLSSSGYLDCPLSDLAVELHVPLFDLEQALFVVQALDPPGVGARSLSECLLLQLVQSDEFNEINIRLVQTGLSLLSSGDYAGLSKQLGASLAEVRHASEVIRGLNPIPSRGFYTESSTSYIVPEATIHCENGQTTIELNNSILPHVSLNSDYCALVGSSDCKDAQPYLKEKMTEAKNLIANVQGRYDTLSRLLSTVVQIQRNYFLKGQELQPMTMKQVADLMGLNTSTISRAVRDKYIQFCGRVIPLRSLFSASLQSTDGEMVSAEAARQQIRRFISAENSRSPLSDSALCEALSGVGILLSRRTVAKYRGELGIPTARERKAS